MTTSIRDLMEQVLEAEHEAYVAAVRADYLAAHAEATAQRLRVQKQRVREAQAKL